MRTPLALLLLSLPLSAVAQAPVAPPPPTTAPPALAPPPATSALPLGETLAWEKDLAKAEGAAKELGKALRTRLTAVLEKQGPIAAVQVCADEAPVIRAEIEAKTGVRVGRASLRTRGPTNVAPPSWVGALLVSAGDRTAPPPPYRAIEAWEARVALPIAVEAPCLICHGSEATIPPDVARALAARYPFERARGYEVGQLRGFLWAAAPVEAQ